MQGTSGSCKSQKRFWSLFARMAATYERLGSRARGTTDRTRRLKESALYKPCILLQACINGLHLVTRNASMPLPATHLRAARVREGPGHECARHAMTSTTPPA